jgi:hypothetical protein
MAKEGGLVAKKDASGKGVAGGSQAQ